MTAPDELWLRVQAPGGPSRDVAVRIAPERPACELVERLASHLGVESRPLRAVLRGRPLLAEGSDVAGLGLRMGDELLLVGAGEGSAGSAPKPPGAAGGLELAAVGGPLAGSRFPLRRGVSTLGRATGSDVHVPDPSVSRQHLRLAVGRDSVVVADVGSRLGAHVRGGPVEAGRRLAPDDVLEVGRSLLAVRARSAAAGAAPIRPRAGRVPFNRPPSSSPPAPSLELRLPAAPAEPQRLRVPTAAALAPLFLGLALWLVTRSAFALLFALGTPLMALVPVLEERLLGRRQRRRQVRRFQERLAGAGAALREMLASEAAWLRGQAPDPCDLEERARRVLPTLWERGRGRPDFLKLRAGWGDMPSTIRAEVPDGGQADLRAAAEAVAAVAGGPSALAAVPITLELPRLGVLGLAGPAAGVDGLARWLMVQAAALHSPGDLVIAAFVPAGDRSGDWSWLRWLPHTRSAGLGADLVADGPEASAGLAAALSELATRRTGQVRRGGRAGHGPAVLVLVHEDAALERAAAARVLRDGPGTDLFVLWVGSDRRQLPDGCRAVVEVAGPGADLRVHRLDGSPDLVGVADVVALDYADRVARDLSGIEAIGLPAGSGSLPDSVGLLACLDAGEDLEAAVRRWWSQPRGDLAAPVGAGTTGILALDLREQGPHALVGGTSGSGKSEFMRAWLTALAAMHSPRRLNFLLVDFKGGTAFQDCARLPHVVGLVTDLSERLLKRVQVSLLAELKRREAEMARFGEKEFVDFERRRPDDAFPVLAVVFDEFEQLLAEHPAFVSDVIVPIARLGRGLGVHLVLGTQKPQGSVPEAIRSNTNIRVALRMLSEAQSRDVIDAPDAARIPSSARGRAFLRLSHQSLTPLQAAYAASRTTVSGRAVVRDLWAAPAGRHELGPSVATDYERLAGAMASAARELGLAAVRRPWLPPLPPELTVAELPPVEVTPPFAPIGLVDDPRRQAQRTFAHSLPDDGHLLVYGAARSGKSTLLHTVACGLAQAYPHAGVLIYGLDFSGGALRPLEALPQVGCVAAADDPERVAQLLRMLTTEVGRRRGRGSTAAACWPHTDDRLVLLVDDYATFRTVFERVDGGRCVELLDALIRDGRAAGVHCVVTTSQRRDLQGLVASAIPRRLVLRPDRQDQEALGLGRDARDGGELPAGRGFCEELEMQVAVPGDGTLGRLAARPGRGAPPVAVLPEDVRRSTLPAPGGPWRAVVGLGGDAVAPVEVDLSRGHLLIAGPRSSGRTTALGALAASLAGGPQDLMLLSPRRGSELASLVSWARTALGAEACAAFAESLEPGPRPTVVLVDDADALAEGGSDAALRRLARSGRDLPIRFVAAVETRALRRYSEWLGELRESRNAVLINPDVSCDGEAFGVGQLPRPLRVWPPGRGFLVSGGHVTALQVAR